MEHELSFSIAVDVDPQLDNIDDLFVQTCQAQLDIGFQLPNQIYHMHWQGCLVASRLLATWQKLVILQRH